MIFFNNLLFLDYNNISGRLLTTDSNVFGCHVTSMKSWIQKHESFIISNICDNHTNTDVCYNIRIERNK